jgi:glycosyltransferase involved in cell wall biosynthesis
MMRIALVGDWPPPFGGVSVHVAALARALAARGADVRVLDIGRGDHAGEGITRARGALRYGAALARITAGRWLVHVHTSGASAKSWGVALAGSRARLPDGPRGVLTIHSGLCPGWLLGAPRRQLLARHACAGYGRVVAVNGDVAHALAACGVSRERIAIVPAFLAAELSPGPPPRRFAALREARAPLFCAAVAPGPTYGEDVLLAAFAAVRARTPRAALVVFGPGSADGPSAAVGLRGGILALGEIDHAAALGVIAASDIFVRATRADGDALSVREALALGRNVVASDVGHRPSGCLLFAPGDAGALAGAMLGAARLPPRGRAGHGLPVRDPFEALLDVYRSAAQELAGPDHPPASGSGRPDEAPCSLV